MDYFHGPSLFGGLASELSTPIGVNVLPICQAKEVVAVVGRDESLHARLPGGGQQTPLAFLTTY
jgi:hypothetical protein